MFVQPLYSWFKMFINEIYLAQCLWHIIDIIIVSPIIWLSYMHQSIISPKKSLQSLQIKIKVNFSRQWSYAYSTKLTHFIFKSIINVHSVSFFRSWSTGKTWLHLWMGYQLCVWWRVLFFTPSAICSGILDFKHC